MTITRMLAVFVTLTAMAMASVAAWDRGGNSIDRALVVSLSVAICAGAHLIPALSKRRIARLLWAGCLLGTAYSHLTFFTHASIRAGDVRAQHAARVVGTGKQIEAAREALAGITARPVTVIAAELATTQERRQRSALRMELAEAQRAAALRAEVVRLTVAATDAEVSAAVDPVAGHIAALLGVTEASIGLVVSLCFAALLEFVGALLWAEALRHQRIDPATPSPIADLRRAIAAGKCKPTVAGIRAFLGCGQVKAMEIRRALA